MRVTERPAKELLSTVTRKGQVTIPVEVRRALGVQPRDQVAFVMEDDQVRLAPRKGGVVARTAGALKGPEPLRGAEELRALAEEAIAEDVRERSGG
jgi:AbrB family looped-hinge helix DNA binding protein